MWKSGKSISLSCLSVLIINAIALIVMLLKIRKRQGFNKFQVEKNGNSGVFFVGNLPKYPLHL